MFPAKVFLSFLANKHTGDTFMIYADHAATTMLSPKAREAMLPWLSEGYGNPSTLYSLARNPRKAIADARAKIAEAIKAKPDEILFTSCGTESDNWALLGTALRFPNQRKRIITSSIEHHAILHTCEFLEKLGYEVIYLPVDRFGLISATNLKSAINNDTILVSIMYANNEIGTIEPVWEYSRIAHEQGVLFHTDAVQIIGHDYVETQTINVNMLSASAHKFNGPKGVGFLYVKRGTPIEPLLHGGGQENGMRSGTENVASIVGMATALQEHMKSMEADRVFLEELRAQLIAGLHAENLDFIINGSENHIPGSVSLSFRNVKGEMLLHRLDLMGIAVATGSACNSKDTVLSHVIKAIEVPSEYAQGTIRITLGTDNDREQIDRIVASLKKIVK